MSPRFRCLSDYLDLLNSKGLLAHIEGADWNCEIGAITKMVAFSDRPRALLFDSIKGCPGYRVATNLYVSQKLQAIALNLDENPSKLRVEKPLNLRSNFTQDSVGAQS